MDMPTLDSLRGGMDNDVFASLGSTIIYLPAPGTAGLPTPSGDTESLYLDFINNAYQLGGIEIKARINSKSAERSYGETSAIILDPTFKILKSALPSMPSSNDRFTSSRYPGKVFKPANVDDTESGTRWIFKGKIA